MIELSSKQFEILKGICKGLVNKEIGYSLGLKRQTIDWHIGKMFRLCNCQSRMELVLIALRSGIVELDEILKNKVEVRRKL